MPLRLAPLEVGGVERAGILAPAPRELRFENVEIPPGARLSFGVGIADAAPRPGTESGVTFSVRVSTRQAAPDLIWSHEIGLPPGSAPPGWLDAEIALDRYAGARVDIDLITEPRGDGPGGRSGWSLPVIRSPGRRVDTLDQPVVRRVPTLVIEPSAGEHSSFAVDVPRDAVLEVAGELVATRETRVGPVRFAASVDGRPLFEQRLSTDQRPVSFSRTLALREFEGRKVELTLTIDAPPAADPGSYRAHWLRSAAYRDIEVARSPASAGRNLLFVVVDTLRADHLGLYGHSRPTSPNLDRFAGDALVFDQAISPAPWTLPATASLLTGLYPPEHQVTDARALSPRVATLAEALQAEGLTTVAISTNPTVGQALGFDQGFEQFVEAPWLRAAGVNDVFRDFLDGAQGLRWFAYLHYTDPHAPYEAPPPESGRFLGGETSRFASDAGFKRLRSAINFGVGEVDYTPHDIEQLARAYDEEILSWDRSFGGLISELRERGLLDATLVVVTSDHGEEFLEHGNVGHALQLYDESVRVPLLLRAPGIVEPGRREDQVETRGLTSTLLALLVPATARAAPPGLLAPDPSAPAFSHTLYALPPGSSERTPRVSVRHRGWKYITSPGTDWHELYDLGQDPGERHDLAEASPTGSRYEEWVRAWIAAARAGEGEPLPLSAQALEEIRNLGYVR